MRNNIISIIGGGSWGTTLAHLASENRYTVRLWVYEKELADYIQKKKENITYLPGVKLPDSIIPTSSLEEAVVDSSLIIFVVPTHVTRDVLIKLRPYVRSNITILSAAKGIEDNTLMLVSEIMRETLPHINHNNFACLSGPSFAREVSKRLPAAVSLASSNKELSRMVQYILTTPYFKMYTTNDIIGVQIGGALKNVIAIAAGGVDGLGLGYNTRAALISRGLIEIIRLGIAMGANIDTFYGLSGVGDLVLTCTGDLSRNKMVGYKIGQGLKLKDILSQMKMVAEGVNTTRSARKLSEKYHIRMPITNEVYEVLFNNKRPEKAVSDLMTKDAGDELE
ncbi:MAG: NAD(P)H-dependent glycerol-3-phosphate dehydrogenase [Nitrospirota bacterium]